MQPNIGILGSGNFGLALAYLLVKNHPVSCWEFDDVRACDLIRTGKSEILPIKLPKNILISSNILDVIKNADILFIAIPAEAVIRTMSAIKRHLKKDALIVIGTKGFDTETRQPIYATLEAKITQKIMVLSGPTFAVELVKQLPSTGIIAGKDKKKCELIIHLFRDTNFHLMYSHDIHGISICGAIKNVYAIGAGILKGLEYEKNTNAWYISRCITELRDILKYFKAEKETIFSVAGVGDTCLSASSSKSRNFRFGEFIGKGIAPKNISCSMEGKNSLLALFHLLKEKKIPAILVETLYDILFKNKNPETLLQVLIQK